MARVGQVLGNTAVFPNSPMRTEHFEYTHIGGLSNFSARHMTAKKFSAPAVPRSWPQISIWGKTGSKTLGGPEGGGGGGRGFEQAAPLVWVVSFPGA